MSDEPKHTPAPWSWLNYPDGRKLLIGPNNAVIHCPDAPISVSGSDQALIAAAPDLFSALRPFLAMDAKGTEITGGEWNAAIVMARAAVEKTVTPPTV